MEYKHFDFLVEEMTEEDADELLDVIIQQIELQGLNMGGGWQSASDADYEFWTVVKDHLRGIWNELKGQAARLFDRATGQG